VNLYSLDASMNKNMQNAGPQFEVKELLWNQIQKFLPYSEWEESKNIIGSNLIEENEVLIRYEDNALINCPDNPQRNCCLVKYMEGC
jgi:hypothetical protein